MGIDEITQEEYVMGKQKNWFVQDTEETAPARRREKSSREGGESQEKGQGVTVSTCRAWKAPVTATEKTSRLRNGMHHWSVLVSAHLHTE